MDRHERRRQRLNLLILEVGSIKDLADRADTPASYISQIKNPKFRASFGDDLAARLEAAAHKPDGWLDQWLPEEGGWDQNRSSDWFWVRELSTLPESAKQSVREQIKAFKTLSKPTKQKRKTKKRA